MAARSDQPPYSTCQSSCDPLVIPEVVSRIINYVNTPTDLLNCACVNSIWSIAALRQLYRGSIYDMRFRTPEIGWLNSLFVASRERFVRNVGFVKHLTIAPENAVPDEVSVGHRSVCGEKCRPLLDPANAETLLRPRGKGPTSLAIPFELSRQDIEPLHKLIIHPELRFLTLDQEYLTLLDFNPGVRGGCGISSVSPSHSVLIRLPDLICRDFQSLKHCQSIAQTLILTSLVFANGSRTAIFDYFSWTSSGASLDISHVPISRSFCGI